MAFRLLPTSLKLRRGLAVVLLASLALAGCNRDKELEYKEQSIYEIYSQAVRYLDQGRHSEAAKYFDEVERQHPYSVWATTAKLMSAYSLYHASDYEEAVTRLDRFIQVHPGNRDIAYAYYLKGLCYYEQIADVRRDQDKTRKALQALEDITTRFPTTPYGRDARLKIDLVKDHLAAKEMDIGRFYLNQRFFLAAVNRFKVVIDTYGTSSHVPEALHRLTEAYTALGLLDEARKTASVLGFNYPASVWYSDSFILAQVSDRQLAESRERGSVAAIPPAAVPASAGSPDNVAQDTERLSLPPQPPGAPALPNGVQGAAPPSTPRPPAGTPQ